jgi:hypothetical protein
LWLRALSPCECGVVIPWRLILLLLRAVAGKQLFQAEGRFDKPADEPAVCRLVRSGPFDLGRSSLVLSFVAAAV